MSQIFTNTAPLRNFLLHRNRANNHKEDVSQPVENKDQQKPGSSLDLTTNSRIVLRESRQTDFHAALMPQLLEDIEADKDILSLGSSANIEKYALEKIQSEGPCSENILNLHKILLCARLAVALESGYKSQDFQSIMFIAKTPDNLQCINDSNLSIEYHKFASSACKTAQLLTSGKQNSDLKIFEAFQEFRIASLKEGPKGLQHEIVAHYLKASAQLLNVLENYKSHYCPQSQYEIFRYALKALHFAAARAENHYSTCFWAAVNACETAGNIFDKYYSSFENIRESSHFLSDALDFALYERILRIDAAAGRWRNRVILLSDNVQDGERQYLFKELFRAEQLKLMTQACDKLIPSDSRPSLLYLDKVFSNLRQQPSDIGNMKFAAKLLPDSIGAIPINELRYMPSVLIDYAQASLELQLGRHLNASFGYFRALNRYCSLSFHSLHTVSGKSAANCLYRGIELLLEFSNQEFFKTAAANLLNISESMFNAAKIFEDNKQNLLALNFLNLQQKLIKYIGEATTSGQTEENQRLNKQLRANFTAIARLSGK